MVKPENIRILVVDDEELLREAIAGRFRAFRFTVDLAGSGNEAWQLFTQRKYQIVVTDIRMPDGDGMELLQKIRKKSFEVPKVFFITGFSDYDLSQLYKAGIDGIFTKPFETKIFMDAIRNSLLRRDELWSEKMAEKSDGENHLNLKGELESLEKAEEEKMFCLGRGGFFLDVGDSAAKFQVNSTVDFNFKFLEDGFQKLSHLSGEGVIRWVRTSGPKPGIGVEFKTLKDSCIKEIVAKVKERINAGDQKYAALIPDGIT